MELVLNRRRFSFGALAAVALAAPLSMLAKGGSAAAQGDDAAQVLSDTATAMAALSSFKFDLTTVQGQSTILRNLELVKVEGAVQRPNSFTATITAKVAIVNVDVDVTGVDGRLWVTDPLADEKTYIEVTGGEGGLDTQGLAALINPDRLMLAAVSWVDEATIDGTETIDGVKTTRITGTVDLARIVGSDIGTPETGNDFVGIILSQMPVTLWIDENHLIRSMEVEGQLTTDESPDVIRRLDLYDFDVPVDIEAPATSTPISG